jgi:hypothetical protein
MPMPGAARVLIRDIFSNSCKRFVILLKGLCHVNYQKWCRASSIYAAHSSGAKKLMRIWFRARPNIFNNSKLKKLSSNKQNTFLSTYKTKIVGKIPKNRNKLDIMRSGPELHAVGG